jgi:hypothetical protein
MNDEQLIELIHNYPVLLDLSQPKYIDSSFKTDIWNMIGKVMKADGKYYIHKFFLSSVLSLS